MHYKVIHSDSDRFDLNNNNKMIRIIKKSLSYILKMITVIIIMNQAAYGDQIQNRGTAKLYKAEEDIRRDTSAGLQSINASD